MPTPTPTPDDSAPLETSEADARPLPADYCASRADGAASPHCAPGEEPEALRLARVLESWTRRVNIAHAAAAELRRLHAQQPAALTDAQIIALSVDCYDGSQTNPLILFARAIEAAHGITATQAPTTDTRAAAIAADAAVMDAECDIPPPGWRCTRGRGHAGPCAAVASPEDTELARRGMERLREAPTTVEQP